MPNILLTFPSGGNDAVSGKVPNGRDAHTAPRLFDDDADDFLCGTAISVYQNSGGPDSNWGAFEGQKRWFRKNISVCPLISCSVPGPGVL